MCDMSAALGRSRNWSCQDSKPATHLGPRRITSHTHTTWYNMIHDGPWRYSQYQVLVILFSLMIVGFPWYGANKYKLFDVRLLSPVWEQINQCRSWAAGDAGRCGDPRRPAQGLEGSGEAGGVLENGCVQCPTVGAFEAPSKIPLKDHQLCLEAAVFYSWFESVGFNRPALRRRSEGLHSFCPAREAWSIAGFVVILLETSSNHRSLIDCSPHICVGFLFLILYPAPSSSSASPSSASSASYTIFHTPSSHTTLSPTIFRTPSLSHTFFHTKLCHTPSFSPTLSHTIFHTQSLSPTIFYTQSLSHTIFQTQSLSPTIFHTQSHTIFHTPSLSHTFFHTQLCHTPSFTHYLLTQVCHPPSFRHHFCHTPSFTHNFVTHTHTRTHRLSPQLCHTPSFTHNLCHPSSFIPFSVTHRLSHTIFVTHHLSHTTLSHTIFVTHHLCHTPSFTQHLWHWAGSGGALGRAWARLGALGCRWRRSTLHGRCGTWRHLLWVLRGRCGTWSHPPWFWVAGVALMALGCFGSFLSAMLDVLVLRSP